jgi:hypothetical protein
LGSEWKLLLEERTIACSCLKPNLIARRRSNEEISR